MNNQIETLEQGIDSLSAKLSTEIKTLFDHYITHFKNDFATFDLNDEAHVHVINTVIEHRHFNDVQRGMLLNIMFFLAAESDIYTQSVVLRHLLDVMQRSITHESDPEFHLRDVLKMVVDIIVARAKSNEPKLAHYGVRLFSYTNGAQENELKSLFEQYGLPEVSISSSSPYVKAKNGRLLLKLSSFTGIGIADFIRQSFDWMESDTVRFGVYSDPNVEIEFTKGSLDVVFYVLEDGKTTKHKIEFDREQVQYTPVNGYEQIEEFTKAFTMGFDIPVENPGRKPIYTAFADMLLSAYSSVTPNHTSDETIKRIKYMTQKGMVVDV